MCLQSDLAHVAVQREVLVQRLTELETDNSFLKAKLERSNRLAEHSQVKCSLDEMDYQPNKCRMHPHISAAYTCKLHMTLDICGTCVAYLAIDAHAVKKKKSSIKIIACREGTCVGGAPQRKGKSQHNLHQIETLP